MADTLYESGVQPRSQPPILPDPIEPKLRTPDGYIADKELRAAVDVALILGQPLLLTGDPGTGKTTLARSIAAQLFQDRYLELQVKSNTGRFDLLYKIDELARFRDSQPNREPKTLLGYLELQPLGEAIVRACGPSAPLHDRAGRKLSGNEGFLREVMGPRPATPTVSKLLPGAVGWIGQERWVVLIDEIDKAPRDTPNDLLEEFDTLSFAIPELNLKVVPPENAPRPVVVVTSNSERSLPEAFLRRCAYHHIPFPKGDALRRIVNRRLGKVAIDGKPVTELLGGTRLNELLDLFETIRGTCQRPPATAELLAWLRLLAGKAPDGLVRHALLPVLKDSVAALAKFPEDQQRASDVMTSWARAR